MAKKQLTTLEIAEILKSGGVGVLPTDTMYGIVGSALNKKAVAKIYSLRKRNLKKPLIVLISGYSDLLKLGIKLKLSEGKLLKKIWPAPVSVILPCQKESLKYLHRGTKALAVRMPKNKFLISILSQTGPLVAPSANLEGQPPAKTIKEAKKYFGDRVDFYFDAGKKAIIPSTLIEIKKTGIQILRSGAGDFTMEPIVH